MAAHKHFFYLTLFHKSYVEFNGAVGAIDSDTLVVAVNGRAFFLRQIHCGEAVNAV